MGQVFGTIVISSLTATRQHQRQALPHATLGRGRREGVAEHGVFFKLLVFVQGRNRLVFVAKAPPVNRRMAGDTSYWGRVDTAKSSQL